VVLLRGHGDVAVGQSLKSAVMHAIYTEVDARLESDALRLGGEITYLNEVEAAKIAKTNEDQVDRPWGLWKSEALAHEHPQ
jgi:HCOMODA/2-hydroxy-3-carboxy-muconic semialdehyde decarboxylase